MILDTRTRIARGIATACVAALFLSACQTMGSGARSEAIGPQLSSFFAQDAVEDVPAERPRIDIVIPIFDPGLTEKDKADYANLESRAWRDEKGDALAADEYVWPELRRAEAVRFAVKLKEAIEDTDKFGAVRVVPNANATGDLYILGRIEESTGEEVEFELEVVSITGSRWLKKSFDHDVPEDFRRSARNEGVDPYQPAFDEAAAFLAKELQYYSVEELETSQKITDLRFGSSFTEKAFEDYLLIENGKYALTGYPAAEDPMLMRTRAIRVRDQLFIDRMQDQYEAFSERMEESYFTWQEQAAFEIRAKEDARTQAFTQGVTGVLLIGVAVAAAVAGAQSDSSVGKDLGGLGAFVAGSGGVLLLQDSFQTSKEAAFHRDALDELGNSIDAELAPQVIEFEEQTAELEGTAEEQFEQWRQFLQQVFEVEAVPDKKL